MGQMDDQAWEILLDAVEDGRCTPFLGSGACVPSLPTGVALARDWAEQHGYPLPDRDDLSRVAEYVAIRKRVAMAPKHDIVKQFRALETPNFKIDRDDPHSILAALPISVYLTTNYVDYMSQALAAQQRHALVEICRWNDSPAVRDYKSGVTKAFKPTPLTPIVYHLHGHLDVPHSLVLTESDYVDFIVRLQQKAVVPHQIERALANSALVFVGYSFADWDFRVIHRGLVTARDSSLRELGVTVQIEPGDGASKEYLDDYFDERNLRVFWGTARDFVTELRRRRDERAG